MIDISRFTHLVFGLTQSPFILEGALKEHFQYYINEYPKFIEDISVDMYVDDIVSDSNTVEAVKASNKNPLSFFEKADLICISDTQI